jgi:2-oxoisovalerate dehydrogenase E1 component
VEAAFSDRVGLTYVQADGTDPVEVFRSTARLAEQIRTTGRPGFLHLRTVRYLGHAGTDVEAAYRTMSAIRDDFAHDPIVGTAAALVSAGRSSADLVAFYLGRRSEIRARALELVEAPALERAEEVIAPLSPRRPDVVRSIASNPAPPDARARVFADELPEEADDLTLAETINRTLVDVLAAAPNSLVFGEDVGMKGGVYGVTRGLQKRFGSTRVFDSLLDEQSILGVALGAGVSGFVPIPEIQYLAYLHNAEDQLRAEGASLSFFSNGQYRNPLVVRIAGYAYQKGFGGHFHNDNSVAVLRDIPGLVVASPAHPSDAAPMLRTCVAAAIADGTVSAFVEPIALYHTRDLNDPGDGVWTAPYAPPERWADEHVPIGEGRLVRDGDDVLIVSWANGLRMSLQAARELAGEGCSCRVLDLRWLNPLPVAQLVEHATAVGRVLIVDETRHSGGVGEGLIAALVEHGVRCEIARVAAQDTFVPLGAAADLVLVGVDDVVRAVRKMV